MTHISSEDIHGKLRVKSLITGSDGDLSFERSSKLVLDTDGSGQSVFRGRDVFLILNFNDYFGFFDLVDSEGLLGNQDISFGDSLDLPGSEEIVL